MSRVPPTSIFGSLASICADGVPSFFAGDARHAAAFAERLLLKFHKRAVEHHGANPMMTATDPAFREQARAQLRKLREQSGGKPRC